MSSEFSWPFQYSFPPFFTIQPNAETRKKQLEIWTQLVLNYCQTKKVFIIDKSSELFSNPSISRQLSSEAIDTIFNYMKEGGKIEFVNSKKDRCYIFWHTPSEWGSIIHSYARANGMANSVETFYELVNNSNAEFKGMDLLMMKKCLQTLEAQGNAEIIGDDGVKFFN